MTKTKLTSELTFAEIKAVEVLIYFGHVFTDIEFTQWLWHMLEFDLVNVEIDLMNDTTAIICQKVDHLEWMIDQEAKKL